MTYEQVSAATADDLKAIMDHLANVEKNVRAGDIAAMPAMLEKWSSWGQMLLLRLEDRTDKYREEQEAASPIPPAQSGGARE